MGLRTGLTTQDPYSKKEYTELCISIPRLSKWSVAGQVFFFSNRQKTRFCSLKLSVLTLLLEPEINNKEKVSVALLANLGLYFASFIS